MKIFKNILFYVISFTWGLLMSFIGLLIILFLMLLGYKAKTFNGRVFIEVGENWGGSEFGCFFICSKNPPLYLKQHECGHGIQNAVLGPFTPFLISIPSMVRYWLRENINKWQFSIMTCTIMLLTSLLLLVPGIIVDLLWLEIVGGILIGYTVFFSFWLLAIETPKYYNSKSYPLYDDIHFEGGATRIGEILFPDEGIMKNISLWEILRNL